MIHLYQKKIMKLERNRGKFCEDLNKTFKYFSILATYVLSPQRNKLESQMLVSAKGFCFINSSSLFPFMTLNSCLGELYQTFIQTSQIYLGINHALVLGQGHEVYGMSFPSSLRMTQGFQKYTSNMYLCVCMQTKGRGKVSVCRPKLNMRVPHDE